MVWARDVLGNVTAYAYDDADNLIRIEEADGNVHNLAYDAAGNLVRASDMLHDVEFDYGPLGTLTGRRQFGRHVRFGYDGELQLREIVNEGGERYAFGLDGLGQVVEETGFDGLKRKYLRDGAGRVVRVVRPGGRQTDYELDGAGNVLEERHHDGRTSRFAYDGDGLLLRAENGETKVAFKRDAAGRVIKETQGGHDIVRTFDPTGRHVHTASSLGASVDYGHDGQGRLQEMSCGEWSAKWLRDSVGLEAERHLTGGVHVTTRRDRFGRETYKSVGARNVEQLRRRYTWDMGNRLLVARDEISGRVARYDYDEFDNLISAEYERGGEVERLYRVPDRMGNLFETRERDDRRYDAGGQLAEDREYFYHYDCEGNLVFKEFKELSWGGNVIAPINKERLETELGIRFRASARAGVMIGRATACSPASFVPTARRSRSHTTPSAAASARHTQERPPTSFGTATCHCTNGRKKMRWSLGSSSKTRSCLPPSLLPMASVSPSSPTTSARLCKPTTSRATRCGSRSWTSTGGKGNGHPPSYRSSIKGSTRMRRLDCITIGLDITTRMRGVILAKTR